MSEEDTLPGTRDPGRTESGLTDQQKTEVMQLFAAAVRQHWTEDNIRTIAKNESLAEVSRILKDEVSAKVAGLVQRNPEAVLNQLFRESGMIVRTKSGEYLDGIVGALLKDEESGIPQAIREHVSENLTALIQNSISDIVARMVVNYIANNADNLATASKHLINQAFQNASFRTS